MDLHKNARSCPKSRALMVRRILEEGQTVTEVAEAQGLSERSVYRWLRRYRAEGLEGLEDRSSSPHQVFRRLGKADQARLLRLRLERLSQAEIAWKTGIPRSTVSRWLRRWNLGRLPQLAPPRADSALREAARWGARAPGYQEAGQDRGRGPPDHR